MGSRDNKAIAPTNQRRSPLTSPCYCHHATITNKFFWEVNQWLTFIR
ncbi:MAG: hypothetical protein V7K98_10495 [Nostoc sp.]